MGKYDKEFCVNEQSAEQAILGLTLSSQKRFCIDHRIQKKNK